MRKGNPAARQGRTRGFATLIVSSLGPARDFSMHVRLPAAPKPPLCGPSFPCLYKHVEERPSQPSYAAEFLAAPKRLPSGPSIVYRAALPTVREVPTPAVAR